MRGKELRETVGLIALVAGLVFVGMEIRQNTVSVRGATLQAVSQQSLDIAMTGIGNRDLRTAFNVSMNSPETLTEEQKILLSWFIASKLRADENRFRQEQLGTLDASSAGHLTNNMVYRFQYFGEWWERNRGGMGAGLPRTGRAGVPASCWHGTAWDQRGAVSVTV